ncbi:hypothetical protein SAMN05216359_1131 [Roseateles sp. YR242]|uniref:hypothetical protein n=1 Tax=Roseateles sp. YR242 TaxID=1855305 RepID=UPI0008C6D2E0|nr:hypothetical protein [Roseateles sp. YR242]SEL65019.1 hypothetical protein SAMN05216359_1131 [Roseateles sp. YR242]
MRFSLPISLPSSLLSDEARQRLNRPWVIVMALLAAPLLAACVYLAMSRSEQQAQAREHALHHQVKQKLSQLASSPTGEIAPYPERLPVDPYPVARAIEHLRAAAESQAVTVATVSANERAATPATLGRVTLDFTLRGGYVAIKAVLNELLSRDAQRIVLQQLSLRRSVANPALGTTNTDVEAQVSVSWLHRPLSANGAATTTTLGTTTPTATATSAPLLPTSPASAPPASASAAGASLPASGPSARAARVPTPSASASSAPASAARVSSPTARH